MTPAPRQAAGQKPRIAILGGGVGSITAAFYLSQGAWRERFADITLYQQGWRLGGKGASGRGEGDERIEEHGLHVWFGFYENAFRMLRECHKALDDLASDGDPRWNLAFKNMEDSFRACTEITVADFDGCGWKPWTAAFHEDRSDLPWSEVDRRPPSQRPEGWSVLYYLLQCLRLAADFAWSLMRPGSRVEIAAAPIGAAQGAFGSAEEAARALWWSITGDFHKVLNAAANAIDALVAWGFQQQLLLDVLDLVLRGLDFVTDFLRRRYDSLVRGMDSMRRAWYLVDLLVAIARGLIRDDVVRRNRFSVIDHVDFRVWALKHGAERDSVDCALVRALVYDLAFGYENGDPQSPSCGAGTALRGLLRTFFTYRGALMYKMNAGMGDVVFAPMYELLHKRGVDIEFFHRVERVHAAGGAITRIDVDEQAQVPAGTAADAYVTLRSVPGKAAPTKKLWPAKPTVLPQGPHVAPVAAEDYESWYLGPAGQKTGSKDLRRGAGFDVVVFGLPIGCVRAVAPDLVAQSERWEAAVEHVRTVPTQAMQLWLGKEASDLGDWPPGTLLGGFVEPYDTWADMSHLHTQEKVNGAMTVAYFCNVLADADPPPRGSAAVRPWLAERNELVKRQALRFLRRDVATLWPKVCDQQTGEFDWDVLAASAKNGAERLDDQYLRANVEPSERYVLSVPGSSRHRIRPDDTGFSNLYAVGDWTKCILDAGCVEAAVISGLRAANAINEQHGGAVHVEKIVGEGHP